MRATRATALALVVLTACGEDEPPPPPPPAAQAAAPRAAAAGRGAGAAGATSALKALAQVESLAADEKEARSLRHQFRDTDFQFDPTGTINRDPFRSYVIRQPGVSAGETTSTVEPTELCPAKRQIAASYNARELKLTGIVARGTTRWALLSDAQQKGHIINRNDCVGKEKARIVEIGATYVRAEIAGEQITGQPPRPPENLIYQLHPQQLPIGEGIESITSSGSGARRRDDGSNL